MENIKVVIEDIKSLRKNAKNMLETAERLEKSIFEIKQVCRKERDQKKKKEYKDALEEIEFYLESLRKGIKDLEDADLFRDKIDIPKIPKHTTK